MTIYDKLVNYTNRLEDISASYLSKICSTERINCKDSINLAIASVLMEHSTIIRDMLTGNSEVQK